MGMDDIGIQLAVNCLLPIAAEGKAIQSGKKSPRWNPANGWKINVRGW
jgi:hypothetical protein